MEKNWIKNSGWIFVMALILLCVAMSCTPGPLSPEEEQPADLSGAFSLSSLHIQVPEEKGIYAGDTLRADIKVVNSSETVLRNITVELDATKIIELEGGTQTLFIDSLGPNQTQEIEANIRIAKGLEEDALAAVALVIDRGKGSEYIGGQILLEVFGVAVYKRDEIPIIGLHAIEDRIEIPIELYTAHFEALCKTLKESGFETITFADLLAHIDYGRVLPEKSVIITSDDGFASLYENAFPILKEYDYTMTVFLITDFVKDTDEERVTNYFDADRGVPMRDLLIWPEIKEMDAYGIEFLSHSANHIRLGLASDEQFMEELISSKQAIESRLDKPVLFFAWPYDNHAVEKWPLIPEAGYRGAVRYWGGIERISTLEINEIKRVEFNSYIDPAHYISYLNLHDIEIQSWTQSRELEQGQEFVLEYIIKNNGDQAVVIDSLELTLAPGLDLAHMGQDASVTAFPGYLEGKYMWVAGGYGIDAKGEINIKLILSASQAGASSAVFRATAFNGFLSAEIVEFDIQ